VRCGAAQCSAVQCSAVRPGGPFPHAFDLAALQRLLALAGEGYHFAHGPHSGPVRPCRKPLQMYNAWFEGYKLQTALPQDEQPTSASLYVAGIPADATPEEVAAVFRQAACWALRS